jgi:hypothetical protein
MKLKVTGVAEIHEAVTDELKEAKKRNFRQLFRKCSTAQNPVYKPMDLILNEKGACLPHASFIFKKISPKIIGPPVYVGR